MVKLYQFNDNNKLVKCADFDGFVDQYDYIKDTIKNDMFGVITEVKKQDTWGGKHSYDQSIQGLTYGFEDVTDYFKTCLVETKSSTEANLGVLMDVQGFAYDMGSVVSGIPECCISTGLPVVTPCIKIMVDIAFSGMNSSEIIYNRGVAITNLINTLLANGVIVDLYMMMYNVQSDMDIMYTVSIDTRNLSISNIAFASSPEYFRKIGFITMDTIRQQESEWGRGTATAKDFMLNKFKKDKIFFIGGSYTNSNMIKHLDSVEDANTYINDSFNTFCKENKINIIIKNIDNKDNMC